MVMDTGAATGYMLADPGDGSRVHTASTAAAPRVRLEIDDAVIEAC
ncbi:MAG: hypothetical protein R3F55_03430 [Alphaproteobacteria bacterium]